MGLRAQSRTRVGVLCSGACVIALLATSGSASAARKPITGELNRSGYTVIALATNGKATVSRASRETFRLRPPARRVTLHLRAPSGTYAGPIVISRSKGRRAIVGVKGGARLGRVTVRSGYARLAARLAKRWVDSKRVARARRGVPIGARVFGRVRSQPPRRPLPADPDLDGIPDRLDIDDDGDLILDYEDRSAGAVDHQPAPTFGVISFLEGPAVNANARHAGDPSRPAFENSDIDAALRSGGALAFGLEGGPLLSPSRSELDCGGLPDPANPSGWLGGLRYCTRGGTGRAFAPGVPASPAPFPGNPGPLFDSDRDGRGTFPAGIGFGPHLLHGASTAEIQTGDVLLQRSRDARGNEVTFSTTLQYVFATVPAIFSLDDDGPGGEPPTQLAYPNPPGIVQDALVAPRPPGDPNAGDVVVTLTFWRPQRSRVANDPAPKEGESAAWTDIGSLAYGIGTAGLAGPCPQSAFLPEDDPSLSDPPPAPMGGGGPVAGGGGYADRALDRPANPNSKLTFTVNFSACLRSGGRESAFDQPGETARFGVLAVGRGGRASHYLSFRQRGGRITIAKRTDPAESSTEGTEFEFDPGPGIGPHAGPGGGNFKLRHEGTRTFDVAPGAYTVEELPMPGYDLTGVACDDDNSTGSPAERRARFDVALNEHVTCTFTNTKL